MCINVKRPMAVAAVASLLLAMLMFYFNGISLLMAVAAITVTALLAVYRKHTVTALTVLAVIVSMLFTLQRIDKLHAICGETVEAQLTVIEDSTTYGEVSNVTVIADSGSRIPRFTKISLTYFSDSSLLSGQRISARLVLNGLADSEYRDYNYGDGVFVEGKVSYFEKLDSKNNFFFAVGKLRRHITACLRKNFNQDTAGLLIALTVGDKSFLPLGFDAAARRVGVSHIMVVSGLHLAIIMGFILKALDRLLPNRFLRTALGLGCVFIITAVCGFTLSVMRAACMFAFASIAPVFRRNNDSLNTLGTAVVVILLLSPTAFLSVSFRLSALAALAIVWVAPFYGDLLIKLCRAKNKFLCELLNSVVTTVSATLFTMPVTIEVFGAVSVVSPITNLLVMYPVNWTLTCSIIALVSPYLVFIEKPFFLLAGGGAWYIFATVAFVDGFPITAVKAGNTACYISYILLLIIVLYMYIHKYITKRSEADADNQRRTVKKRDILKKFGKGVSAFRR